jgi:hypothetical protein
MYLVNIEYKNLKEFLYIFAPFIIISYFILLSIINVDLKGVVYLIGLCVSTILTVFIGNGIVGKSAESSKDVLCNIVTINHIAGISKIPISLIIYCFTFAYILFSAVAINITYLFKLIVPLIGLIVLVISDIIWITTNNCFQQKHILSAIIISMILGLGWGVIINKVNNGSLLLVSGDSNICTMPKKRQFKISDIRKKFKKDE